MSRAREGFTLIELLIVVVIIGILAAIAIPKFQTTKGKASLAAMRSDLRNLTTAQESFFYEHSVYTMRLDSLQFTPSLADSVVISEATAAGWAATATNPNAYPQFCALFMGNATAVAPATDAGIVACR